MNKTKYMIAKATHYVGITLFVGITIGMLAGLLWFIITTAPFMLMFILGFAVLVGIGILFGWAEDYIGRYEGYKKK